MFGSTVASRLASALIGVESPREFVSGDTIHHSDSGKQDTTEYFIEMLALAECPSPTSTVWNRP
jgi:hypothetical protein